MVRGPRFLYLHGFASGPSSKKGVELEARLGPDGLRLERLDLRKPSLERLSFAAMTAEVERAIGGPEERVVLLGSSLGGLVAARLAARDARVAALVLLAPAFQLAARWERQLGPAAWRAWHESGWREVEDYALKRPVRIHVAFVDEVAALDVGFPDVRVPTLIVHGLRDDTVDPQLSRDFARDRRHVRLVEVDDGHELVASLDRIEAEARAFLAPFVGRQNSSR